MLCFCIKKENTEASATTVDKIMSQFLSIPIFTIYVAMINLSATFRTLFQSSLLTVSYLKYEYHVLENKYIVYYRKCRETDAE
jgi:hypothetical protein